MSAKAYLDYLESLQLQIEAKTDTILALRAIEEQVEYVDLDENRRKQKELETEVNELEDKLVDALKDFSNSVPNTEEKP